MAHAVIGPNETPEQLSVRLARPVCMLLRANRLYSTAWLLPGRHIVVPSADFCRKDVGACPALLLRQPSETYEPCEPAVRQRLPGRLQRWSDTHGGVQLPQWRKAGCTRTLRPYETMAAFARRTGCTEEELRRINRYYGRAVPGVQLLTGCQDCDSCGGDPGTIL